MRVKTSFGNQRASSHSSTCGRSSLGDEAADRLAQLPCSSVKGGIGRRCGGGQPFSVSVSCRGEHVTDHEVRERVGQLGQLAARPSSTRPATHSSIAPDDAEGHVARQRADVRVQLARLAVHLEVAAREHLEHGPALRDQPVGPTA